jgi:thymidylate synthase
MFTIETILVEDAWKRVLKEIIDNGEEIEDENEMVTKELLNVMVTVLDPVNSMPPEGFKTSNEKIKRFEKQFLDPDNHVNSYNYGNRLKNHFGFKLGRNIYSVKIDQIESVINRLKRNETTRRATLTVFDPSIDHYQDKIPTLVMIDLKIRKNRIYTTAVWRSHDFYGSWIPNFYGLKGLSKHISECLNINMGPITVHSISAHIYNKNYKDLVNITR